MFVSASAAQPEPVRDDLARVIEAAAAPCDADNTFPRAALDILVARGLTTPEAMVPDLGCGEMARLLGLLAEVGQGDASVGRLLEGHANALELIGRTAPQPLRKCVFAAVRSGAILGVWGADPVEDRLRVSRQSDELRLSGAKLFCSGADGLDAAVALADGPDDGRTLLLVPIDGRLDIDRSAWRPLGMRASGSHKVAFDGVTLAAAQAVVCSGAAYLADPWFIGGAMRFAAVQSGVARGLAEVAAAHLVRQERSSAPHQAARLGEMAVALAGLDGVLDAAAVAWDAGCAKGASKGAAAHAAAYGNLARVAAERALLDVADLVQRAVGLSGLIAPHPLERRLRDALTYVRQPNPDGAREAVGRAFAAGLYRVAHP